MPINIINYTNCKEGEKGEALEHLCDDEWEIPSQISTLENWLLNNKSILKKGNYVADLGFSPRPSASGGGTVLTLQAMEAMVSIGMELYLSEYPKFEDE